jgi:hypothetical protein
MHWEQKLLRPLPIPVQARLVHRDFNTSSPIFEHGCSQAQAIGPDVPRNPASGKFWKRLEMHEFIDYYP